MIIGEEKYLLVRMLNRSTSSLMALAPESLLNPPISISASPTTPAPIPSLAPLGMSVTCIHLLSAAEYISMLDSFLPGQQSNDVIGRYYLSLALSHTPTNTYDYEVSASCDVRLPACSFINFCRSIAVPNYITLLIKDTCVNNLHRIVT